LGLLGVRMHCFQMRICRIHVPKCTERVHRESEIQICKPF
jgi:hypothetical protein